MIYIPLIHLIKNNKTICHGRLFIGKMTYTVVDRFYSCATRFRVLSGQANWEIPLPIVGIWNMYWGATTGRRTTTRDLQIATKTRERQCASPYACAICALGMDTV